MTNLRLPFVLLLGAESKRGSLPGVHNEINNLEGLFQQQNKESFDFHEIDTEHLFDMAEEKTSSKKDDDDFDFGDCPLT